jgi:hypothetical protein
VRILSTTDSGLGLENAEAEYVRRPFAGIIATENPRGLEAVLDSEQLGAGSARWKLEGGASPARTAEALALTLSAMLTNCRQLHLVDPHFGPENRRHRRVVEALMDIVAATGTALDIVCVHCSDKSKLAFFEAEAAKMAARLPGGLSLHFVRWQQRPGGDRLHNRYVLTDVGGVALGIGLDAGDIGETDDVLLLPRAQYGLRWSQYVEDDGAFACVDRPKAIVGTRTNPLGAHHG